LFGQFTVQEIVGLCQYLAETLPADRLDFVTLYTWHKDSVHTLLEFLQSFREDLQGIVSPRLDEQVRMVIIIIIIIIVITTNIIIIIPRPFHISCPVSCRSMHDQHL
jgi:hypothetical protein